MSQPNPNERIQVDTSDEDSIFDSESIVNSNLSIGSSVRDYYYENGRRYHAYRPGQYPIPNDEEEQDRLALVHHLFRLVTGGDLYRAPIIRNRHHHDQPQPQPQPRQQQQQQQQQQPERILDVGTGTGIWALEMAEDFPHSEIIGTDLSPIQPSFAPPNCRFFIDDAESDWTFSRDEAFDYIHGRAMCGGIGDWKRFLQQAYLNLKPGGWVEIQEYETVTHSDDGTHEQAAVIQEWQKMLDQASRLFGKPMNAASSIAGCMRELGFENVTDDIYKCPIGSWPKNRRLKEIGRVGKVTLYDAIEPYTLALWTRVLGYTSEEAQDYVDKVRADILNSSYHIYVKFHYIYAQRPMDG